MDSCTAEGILAKIFNRIINEVRVATQEALQSIGIN